MTSNPEISVLVAEFGKSVNDEEFNSLKDFSSFSNRLIAIMNGLADKLSSHELGEACNLILLFNEFSKVEKDYQPKRFALRSDDNNYLVESNFLQIEQNLAKFIKTINANLETIIEIVDDGAGEGLGIISQALKIRDPSAAFLFHSENCDKIKNFVFNLRRKPSIVNDFNRIKDNEKFKYEKTVAYFMHKYDQDLTGASEMDEKYRKGIANNIHSHVAARWYGRSESQRFIQQKANEIIKVLTSYCT